MTFSFPPVLYTEQAMGNAIVSLILGIGGLVVLYRIARKTGDRPCPNCGEILPVFRIPRNLMQFIRGGCTCPSCGQETDRFGKKRDQ